MNFNNNMCYNNPYEPCTQNTISMITESGDVDNDQGCTEACVISPVESIYVSHPPSRRTSVRRRKKKSKSKGTVTEEDISECSFILNERVNYGSFCKDGDIEAEDIYSIPCPSPVAGSPCPYPPVRKASKFLDSSASLENSPPSIEYDESLKNMSDHVDHSPTEDIGVTDKNILQNYFTAIINIFEISIW